MSTSKDEIIKEVILKSAQQLFQQYGIKKTTMEDIAKAMGKGKSTLYYYYCSKEEIFDAVILKEMAEVFSSTKHAVETAVSAEDKLKAYSITKIKTVRQKANLYKIVSGELMDNVRCLKHLHHQFVAQEVDLVTNILQFGIENGEFNPIIRDNLDLFPAIIVSSLRGLEMDMALDEKYALLENKMESILNIMIYGIKTLPFNIKTLN